MYIHIYIYIYTYIYIYIYIYICIYIYNVHIMLLNFVKLSTLLIESQAIYYAHCSSSSLSTLVIQNRHLI